MKVVYICAFAVMGMVLCGCSTVPQSPYRDPTEVRGSGRDFNSYDFQQCAVAMIDSMLSNRNLEKRIKEQFKGRRPVVVIIPIQNQTYRILDMRPMTDMIQSRLVNSGKFDFIEREMEERIVAELIHDSDSVLVADNNQGVFKTQVAAQYILTGVLSEMRDDDGQTFDSYYKLTMKLHNKKTGIIDWSGEKELRKVVTRPVVGK